MSKYNNPEDGGQSKYWDGFTGGITAPTPRFKCQDNEPPRPRYSDGWFETMSSQTTPAPMEFIKK